MSNPRRLSIEAIAATAHRLEERVADRFEGRGIAGLATELVAIAAETEGRIEALRRPRWVVRAAAAFVVLTACVVLAVTIANVDSGFSVRGVDEWLGVLENGLQDAVFLGLGVLFLGGLEGRLKRRSALAGIHELRSLAHVIDMHQLTKDPEGVLSPGRSTKHSPQRTTDRFELTRYLDYCSEMLSLTSKLAALYAQDTQDAVILGAVRDVQELTGLLSGKIWQKIVILDTIAANGAG